MDIFLGLAAIVIIIGCAIYTYYLKQKEKEIEKSYLAATKEYNKIVHEANRRLEFAVQKQEQSDKKLLEIQEKYNQIAAQYKEANRKGQAELDELFETQRKKRQSELDAEFNAARNTNFLILKNEYDAKKRELEDAFSKECEQIEIAREKANREKDSVLADLEFQQRRFEGLLEPLKKYEMDKQARLFYTIQVPDEYKDDIDFLITTVSKKVQHPDIINKLVWSEYVKPYLDETLRRANIEEKPGIYKLTNIDDGKCYVGKSTNVKKRIQDHMKSSIGLQTIAHQAVHDAIWTTGFWNWTIEVITYCEKDELSELEKYYIDFFKAMEFGYNKKGGG